MDKQYDLKRVNIRVSKDVDDWFTDKSKGTGISKSGLMYLALETYIQQQRLSDSLPTLMERLDNIERGNVSGGQDTGESNVLSVSQ